MDRKTKVLTINWSGEEGSIVKIIRDIEENSGDGYEYYHAYQIGEKSNSHNYLVACWNLTRFYYMLARITGLKYGVGTLATRKLLHYIDRLNPDIIHIHCPNFYSINLYILFEHLKKKEYKVIITNHAEFFYTGNCAHAVECTGYLSGCHKCTRVFDKKRKYLVNRTNYEWTKMKKAFAGAKNFHMTVVSPWQYKRIKSSPITEDLPVTIIENAVNTKTFRPLPQVDYSLKEKHHMGEKKIVLNVTSGFSDDIDDLKGGYYLIQVAKMLPQYNFVVAGNLNVSSKEKLSENIICLGNIKNQEELAQWYNLADLTVLTSKRETYGMACAESLACGTPVVGFEAGGTESIALEKYSEFCEYGDETKLAQLITNWVNKKKDERLNLVEEAYHRYSADRMATEYLALYEEIT